MTNAIKPTIPLFGSYFRSQVQKDGAPAEYSAHLANCSLKPALNKLAQQQGLPQPKISASQADKGTTLYTIPNQLQAAVNGHTIEVVCQDQYDGPVKALLQKEAARLDSVTSQPHHPSHLNMAIEQAEKMPCDTPEAFRLITGKIFRKHTNDPLVLPPEPEITLPVLEKEYHPGLTGWDIVGKLVEQTDAMSALYQKQCADLTEYLKIPLRWRILDRMLLKPAPQVDPNLIGNDTLMYHQYKDRFTEAEQTALPQAIQALGDIGLMNLCDPNDIQGKESQHDGHLAFHTFSLYEERHLPHPIRFAPVP